MSNANPKLEAQASNQNIIIENIRKAWYDGRPIVPIVGAGFSADSGYPILRSICRYLARFKIAMDEELLIPRFATEKFRESLVLSKLDSKHPLSIIAGIGWPDRFWLNQTIAAKLTESWDKSESRHNHIENQITSQFKWLAEVSSTPRASKEWTKFVRKNELNEDLFSWERWEIQGDWRRLIQYFTNYSSDFADELFAQYGFFRNPSAGHRSLAQLVQLLSIQKIFTFNFDDLLEKSLTQEQIQYRVFGMEHGHSLPGQGVVREMLAIIKMHGSHHSILIDERLDKPLSEEYKERFSSLVGPRCVLLVLGCSGDDRRLLDLLESQGQDVTVCWLHFEPTLTEFPKTLRAKLLSSPTNSPGAFVKQLLFSLSTRYPESAIPYTSHPRLPIPQSKPDKERLREFLKETRKKNETVCNLSVASSEDLLDWSAACVNDGFVPIWVDLEATRTLAGIVGVIIDGCRKVDPELPAAVMPIGDLNDRASRNYAIERLTFALQRQRYAVLIDGLKTFGSDLLQHHGQRMPFVEIQPNGTYGVSTIKVIAPEGLPEISDTQSLESLNEFLHKLNESSIGQSIIFASTVDHAKRRSDSPKKVGKLIRQPRRFGGHPLLWVCLATIRRTRPLPMLQRLIAPILPDKTSGALESFFLKVSQSASSPLKILEGGDVWFVRDKRDSYYTFATRFTGRRVFAQCEDKTEPQIKELRGCALAQSFLMGILHRKIASTYFSFEFMQSQDAFSFLEYTYHRISSLRNLSRCIFLCEKYPNSFPDAKNNLSTIRSQVEDASPGFFNSYFGSIWTAWEESSTVPVEHLRTNLWRDLKALLVAWMEFEQTVRSQIPAEQLIRWIQEICDPIVLMRIEGVWVGSAYQPNEVVQGTDIPKLVLELKSYFEDLHARICLERGDVEEARKIVEKKSTALHVLQEALKMDELEEARMKNELDGIECLVRGGQYKDAQNRLNLFREQVLNIHERNTNYRTGESIHRWHHLQVLVHLRGSSWLEFGIENGCLSSSDINCAEALQNAESGIEAIRGPGALLTPSLDGMVVSSGSPGGAYRPYRSVFRTLKGRALIAKLLDKNDATELAAEDLLKADRLLFQRAMRQFDSAKGGLGVSHAILRGWADLHAVEGTLMYIRRIYDKYADSGLIEAKLLSARSHLLLAVAAIRSGRRNAVWWRQYYQVVAQYHTEKCLFNLSVQAKIFTSQRNEREHLTHPESQALHDVSSDVLRRYRKGLDATASFLDNSLERDKARSSRWFIRNIHELLLGTAVAIARFDEKSTAKSLGETTVGIYSHAHAEYPRAELEKDSMTQIRDKALNQLLSRFNDIVNVDEFAARKVVIEVVRNSM